MKSKAPLSLMEQLVMLLVFALAAALCLQAFVRSDLISRRGEARDRAAVLCQSVAETIRRKGGTPEEALSAAAAELGIPYGAYAAEGTNFESHYNGDWTPCDTRDYIYCLRAVAVDSGVPGLGQARVSVTQTGESEPLFQIDVGWQTALDSAIPQEDKDRALREARWLAAEIRECAGEGLNLRETLSGETDGLGGWRRYFDGGWEPEVNYGRAAYELWYREGRVEAFWNQIDDNGFVTGTRVFLGAVDLGEVTDLD